MKILYIAHRIPYPPDKGDKIRSFHQIQHLSKKHEVHLVCFVDEKGDLPYARALEKYCASVDVVFRGKLASRCLAFQALLFSKEPLSVASFYSAELAQKITHTLGREAYDKIFVFSSAMARYVKHISHIPKVMDFVDVDSEKWQLYAQYHPFPLSWIYRLEVARLSRYEENIARIFEHSIFVSEKEAALFRQRVGGKPISVIPNGVDLDYFCPDGAGRSSHTQPSIVFTGAMDYFPNVDAVRYFCSKIFPRVREAVPEVGFYIVGRNPTRQVRGLGSQPGVVVTGYVPDVRPYLAKAWVAIAPLRIARGLQNKILEAMAMGLPVVGTSEAFQGTRARREDGIRMADDSKSFAHAVVTLLKDPVLRRRCSLAARDYVERQHQWQDHGARLESLLHETG